jgi:hypothetical protein
MPYQLFIGPSSSSVPTQEVTIFDSWSLNRNIDDGCSISLTIPQNSPAGIAIEELSTDIWLYLDGQPDQRFRVAQLERTWDQDGRFDASVNAVCYRRILRSRHLNTALSFSGVSQGQILFDLIDHTQNLPGGDLGITAGNLGPTVLRDREYEAGSNILELAVGLSQIVNGLTFDIDENLELQVSRFQDFPLRAQPIVLGVNAVKIRKPSGSDLFANVAIVTGDRQSTTLVIEESGTILTDPRGRWERFQSFSSQVLQSALVQHAEGLVLEANSPAIIWQWDLEHERFFGDSDYGLGDFVNLVDPNGGTVVVQVLTQQILQDADGDVRVSMTGVQVVSAP